MLRTRPHDCPYCFYIGEDDDAYDHFVCHATPDAPLLVREKYGDVVTFPLKNWLLAAQDACGMADIAERHTWGIRTYEQLMGCRFGGQAWLELNNPLR